MARPTRRSLRHPSRPIVVFVLALIILSLVLGACSSAPLPAAAPTSAPAAGLALPSKQAASAPSTTSSSSDSSTSSTPSTDDLLNQRMVVHDAQLTLEVADVGVALGKIRGLAETYGGYVSSEHAYLDKSGDQERLLADVSIRVRADQFDRALDGVQGLATKVVSADESSEDVTQEYVDVDADLRNLQTTESAIQKLMDRATNMNDILTLQNQLTTVRGQIQRLDAQKRMLERQTSLSTLTMHLQPPANAPKLANGPAWSPLATLAEGWQLSVSILRGVADTLLYGIAAFWWLVLLAIGGVYVERRRRQSRLPAIQAGPTNPA